MTKSVINTNLPVTPVGSNPELFAIHNAIRILQQTVNDLSVKVISLQNDINNLKNQNSSGTTGPTGPTGATGPRGLPGTATSFNAGSGIEVDAQNSTISLNYGGMVDVTKQNGDMFVRKSSNITSLTIGFIGDSVTVGGGPSPPTNNPATVCCSLLTTASVTVTANNQAVSGSITADWLPASGTGYLTTAKTAFNTAGVKLIHIMLGGNDASSAHLTTAASVRADMRTIVNDLIANGFIVILSTIFKVPNTNYSDSLIQAYNNEFILFGNGYNIHLGDTIAYTVFSYHPVDWFQSDALHPNQLGANELGLLWSNRMIGLVRSLSDEVSLKRMVVDSSLSIATVAGVETLSVAGNNQNFGQVVWGTPGAEIANVIEVSLSVQTFNLVTIANDLSELEITVTNSATDATPSATATITAAGTPIGTLLSGSGTSTVLFRTSGSGTVSIAVTETAAASRYLWVRQGRNSRVYIKALNAPLQLTFT